MSIAYLNIARAVLLRTGQLKDASDAATFETVYTSALASAVGGVEIPLSELKRMVLSACKRVASACARQSNPVLRQELDGTSASLAHKAAIPTTDSASDAWIGSFTAVRDATTNEPLTEKPKQTILREIRLYGASGTDMLKYRPMHYCFDAGQVLHTRANVVITGSKWNDATQASRYDSSQTAPLAQEVETWVIAEVLAQAGQEGWFLQEAGIYAAIAQACAADVAQGAIPARYLPDTTANIEPLKN